MQRPDRVRTNDDLNNLHYLRTKDVYLVVDQFSRTQFNFRIRVFFTVGVFPFCKKTGSLRIHAMVCTVETQHVSLVLTKELKKVE